ncbi:hypothetical protein BDA96_01G261500 [Sorghum bicolor]|uniref:Uncharacterized protein n=2 Tax=Sorghum bicolor TaxID=4558 RepID=A0A921S0V6_SORBI|nr:hypothetical protein BDA96_01G261500 [Sorghum bicolor]OQU91775.1 hypothetical protein SORBI_3001G247101 [Sorghum bicolor]
MDPPRLLVLRPSSPPLPPRLHHDVNPLGEESTSGGSGEEVRSGGGSGEEVRSGGGEVAALARRRRVSPRAPSALGRGRVRLRPQRPPTTRDPDAHRPQRVFPRDPDARPPAAVYPCDLGAHPPSRADPTLVRPSPTPTTWQGPPSRLGQQRRSLGPNPNL